MKALGIDYGDARIGIAISDIKKFLATPLKTIKSQSMRQNIDEVANIAKAENVDLIIVGLPLNMDGTEGDRASKTRAFGRNLQKVSGIQVEYIDERLSSIEAEEKLKTMNLRHDKQKKVLDSVAAMIILQSYLDTLNTKL